MAVAASGGALSHRFIWGVNGGKVNGNVEYSGDESGVLYTAGHTIVCCNPADKSQRFIAGSTESLGFSAMALCPSRRFVAVAEKADKASIVVFDLRTLRKRKVLTQPDSSCTKYASVSFSLSNESLVALTGDALNPSLVSWRWVKGKVLATLLLPGGPTPPVAGSSRSINSNSESKSMLGENNNNNNMGGGGEKKNAGTSPYFECRFSPLESIVTALSATQLLFIRVGEEDLTLLPATPLRLTDTGAKLSCHCWLKHVDDYCVAGSTQGDLVLFQSCRYLAHLAAKIEDAAVTAVCALSNGFVAGTSKGLFHVYAASEDKRSASSLFEATSQVFSLAGTEANNAPCLTPPGVVAMAVKPTEDSLCATTTDGQVYTVSLLASSLTTSTGAAAAAAAAASSSSTGENDSTTSGDASSAPSPTPTAAVMKTEVKPLFSMSHGFPGAITGLDVCVRKPLAATCGMDRSVRVWNYLDHNCELVKHFSEDPYSISFHPSGLHVIVGFSDKLRVLHLLMDDLRVYREVPIKSCRECAFSTGGQYFAAVNGNVVMVFDFYSCEKLVDLRGHNSKVRSLHWSANDATIVSCGQDGAVYQWDWAESKRLGEFVQKGTVYNCALGTAESVFAVGSDHMMKELEMPDLQPVKQLDGGVSLGQIVLSHAEHMMFAGTHPEDGGPGCVRAYAFPLTGDFLEYACLGAPVTRMRISHDDEYLIVAGEDGTLCVFDVRDRQERTSRISNAAVAAKSSSGDNNAAVAGALTTLASSNTAALDKGMQWSEEILVTKSDLEEKNLATQELRNKIEELQLHNEYQLRLKDMSYTEKIKEVTEKYMQDLEQEKNKYELLREEKNDIEMECEDRHRTMEETHHHELQELENGHQQKIMLEVERYQQLAHERDLHQRRWEEQRQAVGNKHEAYVSELTDDFEQKLEEDRGLRLQLEDERTELNREFKESKSQLEEDIDTEIANLRHRYDTQLAAEREATLRYKGENGIMKKKFTVLTKDIEDQKEAIKLLLGKEKELQEQAKKLEREIAAHKTEIRRRDDTIGAREKKIHDLKKKNQELEKFKFVLDYKIKELKRQIEPRETEISNMKAQIKSMDRELEQYHKSNAQLDLMIGELRLKLDSMQAEILVKRAAISDGQAVIRRSKAELHACVQHHQDPAMLREKFEALARQHLGNKNNLTGNLSDELDEDVLSEYKRHEDCLRRSLSELQLQYERDLSEHSAQNIRVMTNNMGLIREISKQRDANKQLKLAVGSEEARLAATAHHSKSATRKPTSTAASSNNKRRAEMLERHLDNLERRLEEAGIQPPPKEDDADLFQSPPSSQHRLIADLN